MIVADDTLGELLPEIVPLAAAAAISPVLFLLMLTTLTGPRPITRGTAVFLGVLIAVGLRALLKPPKPKEQKPDDKEPSIGRSFVAGAAAMGSNVTTFALYIPALALIAGSDLPLGQQAIAALIILLITLMVAWIPLLLAATIPAASSRILPAIGDWMTRNDRWIQVALGLGFGIWLLIKGVQGL
jgi:hypothetical protein